MPKQKVCFVVSTAFTAHAFLKGHIEALSEEHEVYLAGNFSRADMPIINGLKIYGFMSIPVNRKIKPAQDVKAIIKLAEYFRKMKFSAVHSVTPKPGLASALAGRLAGVPKRIHIFTGQVWHTRKGLFRGLLKTIDRLTASLSTDVLVDGCSQREYLINEGVIKKEYSQVFGKGSISGVDLRSFKPDADLRSEIRKSLNIPDEKIVFLFLGRMNRDKGIVELIEAFRRLREINPSVFLLLAGFDEESLVPYAAERLSSDDFYFYGPTQKPHELYQACDVFCLPSHREGFGSSVIEASASAKAVIASDTYGLMDALIDNETGLRHKTGDVDSLFGKMRRLAENKELRVMLGEKGLKYVKENFSSEIITAHWLRFYRELLRNTAPRKNYINVYQKLIKPLGDFILSLLLLVLTLPLTAFTGLLLMIFNGGKIFFIQNRPGLNGIPFRIIKFRTMNDRRNENGVLLPDEERLTAVGKIIRKLSIDELPQLLNVIRGDMSLIGPRPLLTEYMPFYDSFQKRRHEVKPGITGWAQVNGRNRISWESKFQMDVFYVDNAGFRLDMKIAFMTLIKILKREGISSSTSSTMEKFSGSRAFNISAGAQPFNFNN
ncbi:MAG TPA: sugar transferase [Ignavibacteriales bacterium]|nr:sugar transferase [Ignavibacteriales bacterium]